MTSILNYLVLSSIYLVTFYLIYASLLSNDTHFIRNRIYIIASVSLSLILPLLKISLGRDVSDISPVMQGVIQIREIIVRPDNMVSGSRIAPVILLYTYLAGVLLSIVVLIIRSAGIFKIISGSKSSDKIVLTDKSSVSGFSAFGYIFLYSGLSEEDRAKILKHEMSHVEHLHYADLLLIKIASVLMWFNPIIYLYERSLRVVHEYQADEIIIGNGESISVYQRLILDQALNTHIFTIQNGFSNRSLIKKRIIMMTKERNGKIAGLKVLVVIPVIAAFILLFSCTTKEAEPLETITEPQATESTLDTQVIPDDLKEVKEVETFTVVEKMPTFLGGDFDTFRTWIGNNVKYPSIAVKNGIQGKVYVMFVINKDGTVSNVEVIRGADPVLDQEAVRVVKSSPNWEPGSQRSQFVAVKATTVVNFVLQ